MQELSGACAWLVESPSQSGTHGTNIMLCLMPQHAREESAVIR